MQNEIRRAFWVGTLFGAAGVFLAGLWLNGIVSAKQQPAKSAPKDNEELAKLYAEDQSDRMPKDDKPIDWAADKLQTGADY